MMYRKFISIILATAVAITGLTAGPARAADDDLLKLLAGVAAVAIVGTAIAKHRKKKDDYAVSRGNVYRDDYRYDRDDDAYYDDHRRGHKHSKRHHRGHDKRAKPLPHRVQRKLLPGYCRVQARTKRGERFGAFGARCLENNFRYARALPQQCATRARIGRSGGKRHVYESRCLRDYGYRVSRR